MTIGERQWRILAASLTVTAKGRVTLKRDLLQHLGVRPGERVDFEKLPGGSGAIGDFLHSLDRKVKRKEPLSIEDMNRIGVAGWAGNLDQP